ncbi:unnamed protein product [Peronospora farinosa]|uniref:Tyrosinase copper-binding domain-containing protein n=1 Tax=Peronospora farinosa TaxID=134698 RepID=A0AAV0UVP2_9STRA|nr:unnamed protein product [Peronospora farinosa]CAI5741007.1 unnamed protein product [Peronospora farinosa]
MKLLWILSVALLALISRLAHVEAQACGSRLRKDWDMLTATEKTTYQNAIRASMDSGAYIKFVEMHTEMRSEMEAHQQCMFIYWHRLLLIAFENMLRGQGAAYACVTVPYFNWIVASARVTSGACNSFGNCLDITRELGGFTSGTQRTLNINGVDNSGRCINTPPLDRFCERSSLTGTACARCVPRSDWSTVRVPSSASYASVRAQVFNGANIGEMASLVERGCHNNVHANLDGTMGTFASPADPIFWSHHATVDLLHVVFHKCRVGTNRLTFEQKASHPVAWMSCARRDSGIFRPTDTLTMRPGEEGINSIPGSSDPLLGRFFAGVPNQFAGLMDIRDLGTSSYGYAITGQIATMYSQCDASPTSRRLKETAATNTSSTSVMCGVAVDADSGNGNNHASQNNFPETDYTGEDDGHKDVVIVDGSGNPIDADTPREAYCSDKSEKRMVDWYDATLDAMGGDSHENMDDIERQACMFEDQCLGGTKDYSPEFKALWKVKEPRCKTIVDAINNRSQSIQYESWRENMEARFGCPEPTGSTDGNSYRSSLRSSTMESQESNDMNQLLDLLRKVDPTTISTMDN